MDSCRISSLQNPLVKHLVFLRTNRKFRAECKAALVTGEKVIQELALHHAPSTVLHTAEVSPPALGKHYLVTPEVIKKVSGLPSPEGIVAEFPIPEPSSLEGLFPLLALEGLADPGNVGTLVRSALAFGWKGVFLLTGSTDLFGDKTIRASRGASFRLPYRYGTWEELAALIVANNLIPLVADMRGEPFTSPPERPLLVLGSEAHGISDVALEKGHKISVPMRGDMESLNVAVAGAILMYQLSVAK